jgi:hypothetical protein
VEYNVSKTFARIGGALIIAGLLLPWYKFDLSQLTQAFGGGDLKLTGMPTSQTFSAFDSARTVFFIVGGFGVLALTQIPFATPGIVGKFFMIAGFAGVVLLGYKIVHPPLDFLELLKMKLKPQPGIFLTLIGMALATYGGWEQVKQDLSRPRTERTMGSDWHMTETADASNQAYAQQQAVPRGPAHPTLGPTPTTPQQAQAQQVAGPRVIPPDPFAPKPPTAG